MLGIWRGFFPALRAMIDHLLAPSLLRYAREQCHRLPAPADCTQLWLLRVKFRQNGTERCRSVCVIEDLREGNRVGLGIAQAVGEWMTTDFVPFNAPVIVENYTGPATLVLVKDNASGLPEFDDSVSFPIIIE